MSTNISKQKRDDLLGKIKEIRTFISSAPQDENTGNLLSYLCPCVNMNSGNLHFGGKNEKNDFFCGGIAAGARNASWYFRLRKHGKDHL